MPAKTKQRSQPITKSRIERALKSSKATTMTALYRAMGGKGSVPGSTSKKIRALVPDIGQKLAANKSAAAKGTKKATKKPAPRKPVAKKGGGRSSGNKSYSRAKSNPFREGSGYAQAYDVLAAHKAGMRRDQLVELYASVSTKSLKKAGYDVAVVLSAKESPTGPRHRSCREGYWVEKTNDHVRLRLD